MRTATLPRGYARGSVALSVPFLQNLLILTFGEPGVVEGLPEPSVMLTLCRAEHVSWVCVELLGDWVRLRW